jgi:hypothetical protein
MPGLALEEGEEELVSVPALRANRLEAVPASTRLDVARNLRRLF